MKHFIYLIILIALTALTISGQKLPSTDACKLPIDKLPKIHGLSIGMSISEVKTKFKTLKTKEADENGLQIALARNILGQEFSDVEIIKFIFLDKELQEFDIQYKAAKNFMSVVELSKRYSALLRVPEKSWVNANMVQGGGWAIAKCYGFDVKASSFDFKNGQKIVLQLSSINYKQTMLLRKVKKREENRK